MSEQQTSTAGKERKRARNLRQKKRINARRRLTQILYQWQITGDKPHRVLDLFVEYSDEQDDNYDKEYFELAYQEITSRREELDVLIEKYAKRATDEIDPVEHAILWIGFYEILYRPDIHNTVVINEAVELVKLFGAVDTSYRFINEILDKCAKNLSAEQNSGN